MSDHPTSATAVKAEENIWVDSDTQTAKASGSVRMPDVYLTECASCGGQFPSFRATCAECEDVADADGYRDGRKAV